MYPLCRKPLLSENITTTVTAEEITININTNNKNYGKLQEVTEHKSVEMLHTGTFKISHLDMQI